MNKQKRLNSLLPNGKPKWIRCYDNGGDVENGSFDRYTVIFSHAQSFYTKGWVPYLAMSTFPFHPQGFGMHLEMKSWELMEGNKPGQWPPKIGKRGNLGVRIKFEDLPVDCQSLVLRDYKDYWEL